PGRRQRLPVGHRLAPQPAQHLAVGVEDLVGRVSEGGGLSIGYGRAGGRLTRGRGRHRVFLYRHWLSAQSRPERRRRPRRSAGGGVAYSSPGGTTSAPRPSPRRSRPRPPRPACCRYLGRGTRGPSVVNTLLSSVGRRPALLLASPRRHRRPSYVSLTSLLR